MSNELTESIKEWINRFDEPLDENCLSQKEKDWFKKGLIAGLQKGLEVGQCAGESGVKVKLEIGGLK